MGLGEKLFEEVGKITNFKVVKVHPLEGITTEISFASDVRGIGRFPSGKNLASGTMTRYPHGIIDAKMMSNLFGGRMKKVKYFRAVKLMDSI